MGFFPPFLLPDIRIFKRSNIRITLKFERRSKSFYKKFKPKQNTFAQNFQRSNSEWFLWFVAVIFLCFGERTFMDIKRASIFQTPELHCQQRQLDAIDCFDCLLIFIHVHHERTSLGLGLVELGIFLFIMEIFWRVVHEITRC